MGEKKFVHKMKASGLISNTVRCICSIKPCWQLSRASTILKELIQFYSKALIPQRAFSAAAHGHYRLFILQWVWHILPTGYGIMTDGYTTYINASTCTVSFQPTNPPIIFDLPTPQGSWSTTAHLELGKVYKLPFSNYKTYILLHVYFKIGGRGVRICGNHGVFVLG